MRVFLTALLAFASLAACAAAPEAPLRVGSKRFTESYILGEIVAQAARRAGAAATHSPGLGNTAILVQALSQGAIDVYPEYTGTISREILGTEENLPLEVLDARLRERGLAASVPLGFSDSYAIGVRGAFAREHGIAKISDLARVPGVRLGFSHEFLGRRDGWPGLAAAYGLSALGPRGLDHGLAYEALAAGEVDAIDLYSTDAKIARYGIVVLADDRAFFPRYDALLLHRVDVAERHPAAWRAVAGLEGRIDGATMIRLNAEAEIGKKPFADVAAGFLSNPSGGGSTRGEARSLWSALFAPDFGRLLAQHLALVFASLAAAVALGIPLGIAAARWRVLAQPILIAAGLLQTVPALALLAFLIPVTGSIGLTPALLALFLYALLPIVRNTHAGLLGVPAGLRQAALALGLGSRDTLLRIELPIAAPTLLAGVKVAAVINVGTATIAAFIGAGGFGERIAQGLALNDNVMLLAGAIPAAVLALAVHGIFEGIERWIRRGPR
ncbi:MAG TPA: glycine betaine ABC transporter substrate-binding protein [Usitatibacter sp.]|jgi:osmoprotectant transport system permease protein|nr:glycine betaine ABC transporter substrate-binding protein [Usitatibacter sp.]